jgi:hypothetical protein
MGEFMVNVSAILTFSTLPSVPSQYLGMAINPTTPTGTITPVGNPVATSVTVIGYQYAFTGTFKVVSRAARTQFLLGVLTDGSGANTNGVLATCQGNASVTTAYFPSVSPVLSNGAIEQVRPVSQSILVTYMGPKLTDGGTIAMSYVPPDFIKSNYYSVATNSYGQGQFYENLMKLEGAYNGRLATGAYGWWSPYDTTNMVFQTVDQHNTYNFPGIICSGVFTPIGSTIASGVSAAVLRIEVVTVYEFITKSTAFDQEKLIGSQAIIDGVNNLLMEQPHCMANGKHLDFARNVARGVMTWARANSGWLIPAGKAVMAAII